MSILALDLLPDSLLRVQSEGLWFVVCITKIFIFLS